ncbi:MAG: hypothetical protein U9R58_05385 [Chloroflexota bacterium]|nr:hypothetical protein [Chloroflexota bacterium]
MSGSGIRRISAIVLLLVSLVILIWGIWPIKRQVHTTTLTVDPLQAQRQAVEQFQLSLETPARIRLGDTEQIFLTLGKDGDEKTSSAASKTSQEVGGTADLGNNDLQNIIVQARLDLPGISFTPKGELSQSMRPGTPVVFSWRVLPEKTGNHKGTIWVHLQHEPESGDEIIRQPLTAQVLEIEAISLFGLSGSSARVIGSVGVIAGVVFGLVGSGVWLWDTIKRRLPSDG